jgi:hypothetical protein
MVFQNQYYGNICFCSKAEAQFEQVFESKIVLVVKKQIFLYRNTCSQRNQKQRRNIIPLI